MALPTLSLILFQIIYLFFDGASSQKKKKLINKKTKYVLV